jgi:sporulation protein YlmC with PRC-barrel domain
MNERTEVDLALGILDHQLLDRDGVNCGKVDDLELTGLDGDSPRVSHIVVGPGAWRSRGRLGRIAARLSRSPTVLVPWAEVEAVTSLVRLARPAAELGLDRGDRRWARLVRKAPGA